MKAWIRWQAVALGIVSLACGSPVRADNLPVAQIHGEESVATSNPDGLTYRDFCYKKAAEGRELKIHMIAPADWNSTNEKPALVYFHGGGWVQGAPKPKDGKLAILARRGMVCFTVEYRLLDRASNDPPIHPIQDAKSAMRWVRSHAKELGVDPERIAAGGGSAGAYLAAFVTLVAGFDDPGDDVGISTKAQAMVLFSPVIENGPGGFGHQRMGDRYKELSPFYHVSSGAPPAIILVGDQDQHVPERMIREFESALEAAGTRCDLHLFPGEGHSEFLNNSKKALPHIESFFESLGWLKKPKP